MLKNARPPALANGSCTTCAGGLYHIQRLSLAFHMQKQTGDLISRVTSDIDAIQLHRFRPARTPGRLPHAGGHGGVMFYINWRFTLSHSPSRRCCSACSTSIPGASRKASREVGKKKARSSRSCRKSSPPSRWSRRSRAKTMSSGGWKKESPESVEIALRARSLKAKLSHWWNRRGGWNCLVLWYGGSWCLAGPPRPAPDRVHLVSRQDV